METTKCPVCGRTGIPDYLNENIVCPNCNSDLGVYRTLHALAEGNNGSRAQVKRYKMLSIVLSILTVLLIGAFLLWYINGGNNVYDQKLATADTIVKELKDSIKTLSSRIDNHDSTDLYADIHYIEYTIRPNDSPWRIVNKIYGNRKDWENVSKIIAENNNLWDSNAGTWKDIKPGQIIRIYNIK